MRVFLLGLLLVLPAARQALASKTESTGQDSMSSALRKVFKADEQWLLSVVLSDEAQAKAFEEEGRTAALADESARKDFEFRWRRKAVAFAQQYQKHLTSTDIVPDAPSVEKMVSDFEFNVMNYWLMHQPPKVQAEVRKNLADGNSVLGFMRGTVEERVRNKRKEAASEMAKYIASPEAQAALAYKGPQAPVPAAPPGEPRRTEPGPKPEPLPRLPKPDPKPGQEKPGDAPSQGSAREQLERAAGESGAGARAPTPEESAGAADRQFSGGGGGKPPAAPSPEAAPSLPNAGLVGPQTGGGFQVKPPPSPVLDRESKAKSNPVMAMAKEMMPSIVGGILGGLLSFLIGGPIGLVAGVLLGAAAGYMLTVKF